MPDSPETLREADRRLEHYSTSTRVAPERTQQPLSKEPFSKSFLPGGEPWMYLYRQLNGYLVRLPGLADFEISTEGRQIVIHPEIGISRQTIDHLHLNQALPLALSLQKKLVLHGSAVSIGDVAVAFIGQSGSGKSTLAAGFSVRGLPFMTDDALLIEAAEDGYLVMPSHASVRLWNDSIRALAAGGTVDGSRIDYSSKLRILADGRFRFCRDPRRLRCAFFLGAGSALNVAIELMPARQAVIELIRHCFLLGADEHATLAWNHRQVAEFVEGIPVFRLDYPRNYEMLDLVVERVCDHVRSVERESSDMAETTPV